MSKVSTLVDLVLRLKRISQTDVSINSGINQSNLSKFLAGESDIRSSSLVAILTELGIDLEKILENEIDVLMGKTRAQSKLGESLEVLVRDADQYTALRILDAITFGADPKESEEVTSALEVVNEYKSKIKSVTKPIRSLA